MAMVAPGMRREQPLHPTSQVAIMMGPQYQMEVVGHEAIPEQVHRHAGAGVDHRLDEGVIIAGLVEDGLAAVAPIEGVIPHATDRGASGSRHVVSRPTMPLLSIKPYVPVFLAVIN